MNKLFTIMCLIMFGCVKGPGWVGRATIDYDKREAQYVVVMDTQLECVHITEYGETTSNKTSDILYPQIDFSTKPKLTKALKDYVREHKKHSSSKIKASNVGLHCQEVYLEPKISKLIIKSLLRTEKNYTGYRQGIWSKLQISMPSVICLKDFKIEYYNNHKGTQIIEIYCKANIQERYQQLYPLDAIFELDEKAHFAVDPNEDKLPGILNNTNASNGTHIAGRHTYNTGPAYDDESANKENQEILNKIV